MSGLLRHSLLVLACSLAFALHGQEDSLSHPHNGMKTVLNKLNVSGYGVVNYYAFNWETLPDKRNAIDAERLNLYLTYDFTEKIQLKTEIEFEHGGTGAAVEFDPLEEFGEFEQEVLAGGQVVLEQLNIFFKIKRHFNVRVGKMRFYMGNASKQDEPREYFTAYRSEIENSILPLGWYETGIELSGDIGLKSGQSFPHLSYKAYVVSGLDNTGFSSLNWIRRGYQTRFETINANNLAYALRLDYVFAEDSEIGFNVYASNPTGNRPKPDFTDPSWVFYGDVHFTIEAYPWRARAFGMLGHIQNSEALSAANRNLSNNLGVKRTPVASMAGGAYAEVAFDMLSFATRKLKQELYLFGRYERYDSMLKTEGNISDNPRYDREVTTLGINFFVIPSIVLKAHYAWRSLGSGEQDNTFAMGLGFDF